MRIYLNTYHSSSIIVTCCNLRTWTWIICTIKGGSMDAENKIYVNDLLLCNNTYNSILLQQQYEKGFKVS